MMTKDERKARFDVAIEIVNSVYVDLCHDRDANRGHVYEFCCLMHELRKFGETLNPNRDLDSIIKICDEIRIQHEQGCSNNKSNERGSKESLER